MHRPKKGFHEDSLRMHWSLGSVHMQDDLALAHAHRGASMRRMPVTTLAALCDVALASTRQLA